MWWASDKKEIPCKYVIEIREYNGAVTRVSTIGVDNSTVPITVGLH